MKPVSLQNFSILLHSSAFLFGIAFNTPSQICVLMCLYNSTRYAYLFVELSSSFTSRDKEIKVTKCDMSDNCILESVH